LGFTEVLVREAPRYERDNPRGLSELFGGLLAVRLLVGALTAALYLLAMTTWLRDVDPCALCLLAGAVFIRAPADLCFSLQLGQNRAVRWGLEDLIRLWGSMVLMLPGYLLGGLRGAALGVLLLEIAIAVVGLFSVRSQLVWASVRLKLTSAGPLFRFGLVFYVVHLMTAAFDSSGEVLLRAVQGDYARIAFFRVAYSIHATAVSAITWTTFAFAPLLTTLCLDGKRAEIRSWLERVSKGLGVGCVMVLLAAVVLGGDLVPLVFGQTFRAVAQGLVLLTVGLLAVSLSSIANLAAFGYGRGGVVLGASAVQLAAFWLLGPMLVREYGWIGASLGVVCAQIAQAVFSTIASKRREEYSLRAWLQVVLLGALLLPLGLIRGSALANAGLLCASLLGYAVLLWRLRLITGNELRAMKSALRQRSRPRAAHPNATVSAAEELACGSP
jgi:O-antigen/teichoic acid export membrane protein